MCSKTTVPKRESLFISCSKTAALSVEEQASRLSDFFHYIGSRGPQPAWVYIYEGTKKEATYTRVQENAGLYIKGVTFLSRSQTNPRSKQNR